MKKHKCNHKRIRKLKKKERKKKKEMRRAKTTSRSNARRLEETTRTKRNDDDAINTKQHIVIDFEIHKKQTENSKSDLSLRERITNSIACSRKRIKETEDQRTRTNAFFSSSFL